MQSGAVITFTILFILGGSALGAKASEATQPTAANPPTIQNSTVVTRALKKCAVCHGKNLHGKKTTPAIAGLREALILRALEKPPRPMKPIARGLTPAQKRAVASAVNKLPKPTPVPTAPPK